MNNHGVLHLNRTQSEISGSKHHPLIESKGSMSQLIHAFSNEMIRAVKCLFERLILFQILIKINKHQASS